MQKLSPLIRRFPFRPAAAAGTLLLILTLAGLAGPSSLRAGPHDLKAFAGADVRDLTLDATQGVLYFHLRGMNYIYRPRSVMPGPVSLAELAEAIRFSETLLIEEANPRQTADWYDGRQTARVICRILVKPCAPGKR